MAEETIQPKPNTEVEATEPAKAPEQQPAKESKSPAPRNNVQRQSSYRQGGQRQGGNRQGGQRQGGRGRQQGNRMRRRVCSFCVDKVDYIDYKKPELLASYVTHHGKIYSRRRTGTCAKHQRRLAVAIKRARFLAFLPYTADHVRLHGSGDSRQRRSSDR